MAASLIATSIAVAGYGSVPDWSSHSALLTDFKIACVDTLARPRDAFAAATQMNAKLVRSVTSGGVTHTAWQNIRNGHRIDIWLDEIDDTNPQPHRGICTVGDFNDNDDSLIGLKEWLGVDTAMLDFQVYDFNIDGGRAVDVFNLFEHKYLEPDRKRRPYRLIVTRFKGGLRLIIGNQYSDLGGPSEFPTSR